MRRGLDPSQSSLRPFVGDARRSPASGEWLIAGYDDVVTVLTNPDVFSSSVSSAYDPTLLGADPPAHAQARAVVMRALGQSMRGLEERVRGIVSSLADELATDAHPELMRGLARPLPLAVMAELLGLDSHQLASLGRAEGVLRSGGDGGSPALDPTGSLLEGAIDRRVRDLRHDLISALLRRGPAREQLDRKEVLRVSKVLLIAGTETTANLIGSVVLTLMRRPDELGRLRADPSRTERVIDETLRCESPVQFVRRCTTQRLEVAGQVIPAGAYVSAMLGLANRDERRVRDPGSFDPSRASCAHLAFGAGPHRCPGASVARMEARLAVTELVSRGFLDHAALSADDVQMSSSPVLRGPARIALAADAGRSKGERK